MFKNLIKLFRKNRFALVVFLFFLLDIGYYFLLRTFTIENQEALYEAITSFILILFFSFILHRIHSYYHSRSAINIVHLSIILIFSLLCSLFLQEYGQWITRADTIYYEYLNNAFYLRWFILFMVLLTVVNQLWIDKHLVEQSNAFNRLVEKERQLVKSEITNLQQQFQPHFLFNSLNSISALVKKHPEEAREMIHNLSDFLRSTIQKSKDELITVHEELEYLNLYLAIEKVRFGHRLEIQIDVNETCSTYLLPSLLLQPIVENAIKYGIYGNVGNLIIKIAIRCDEQYLMVSINNPYDKDAVSASKGTGFGLESTARKLSLLYHQNDLLKIEKTDNQFTATVKIPQR